MLLIGKVLLSEMACELCRTFILDYLNHPLHPENRLTAIFHRSKLLPHKELLCFWIQRILRHLVTDTLQRAKENTEMDFFLDKQVQVPPEVWNKAFLKNLREVHSEVSKEFTELQSICEECGFLKGFTELFFIENFILPCLLSSVEIHSEHTKKPEVVLTLSTFLKKYTMKELREEYGNLYD